LSQFFSFRGRKFHPPPPFPCYYGPADNNDAVVVEVYHWKDVADDDVLHHRQIALIDAFPLHFGYFDAVVAVVVVDGEFVVVGIVAVVIVAVEMVEESSAVAIGMTKNYIVLV
jgi:hypothetical protein